MKIFSEFANDADAPHPRPGHDQDAIRANLRGVGVKILVASAKGGVGKSIIAVNLAVSLALKGRKIAVVDADLNAPSVFPMLGMKPPPRLPFVHGIEPAAGPYGLRVVSSELLPGDQAEVVSFLDGDSSNSPSPEAKVPSSYSNSDALSRMLGQMRIGEVDFAIIDSAPGMAQLKGLLSIAEPDGVLMVSHPSALCVKATREALNHVIELGGRVVGLAENMAGFNCDGCRSVRPLMPEGSLASLAAESRIPVVGRLSFDPRLAECSDRGVPFVRDFAQTPVGKALTEIGSIVEKLIPSRRQEVTAPQ